MRLYNTLTRSIETFTPQAPPKVSLYACGLTVYDYTHLGHLRKYTLDDVLVRTLRHVGYEVKFVQNITDVGHLVSDADTGEDKLEKGAKKYNKSVWDIAKEFEAYFFKSMDAMGNFRPDITCRATEHIEGQIALVKKLEAKGFTYKIDDDGIYFDTSKLPDYGKLNPQNLDELKEGERIGIVAGKKNPTDFALWKFEKPGEDRQMSWPSPWSERGFPGWHIECSAMSMQYLGEQLDIHTGGID
ncbi:MAG: class I tRNA ligase family protein, partial [bacterium]|nr:class I tRNA ligase family protein [bacterium]